MSGGGGGEKTELPTPKKERDARQKGQVARSQEVVTTASLLAVIAYIWMSWGDTNARFIGMFDQVAALALADFETAGIAGIYRIFWDAVVIMLPILGVVVVTGIAANYFQFGSLFTFHTIMPKGEKISPASGFKRIFSMKQVVELLKSVLKIAVLSGLLYFIIRDAISPYVNSLECGLRCILDVTVLSLGRMLVYAAIAFVVVAAADFAYQRRSHTKSLMMTKEEVKREYKESEGDPHIKGKRRQLAQELAMSDAGAATRKATALVVNPVHLAVAIDYAPERMPLPVVVAKGRNMQAYHLRREAEEAGVPVFRNVGLARALYADAALHEPIPDELFEAVAEVLAWIGRNRGGLYKGRVSHGAIDMDAQEHRGGGQPARP